MYYYYSFISCCTVSTSDGVGQILGVSIIHLFEFELLDSAQDTVKSHLPLSDNSEDSSDSEPDGHDHLSNKPRDYVCDSTHF